MGRCATSKHAKRLMASSSVVTSTATDDTARPVELSRSTLTRWHSGSGWTTAHADRQHSPAASAAGHFASNHYDNSSNDTDEVVRQRHKRQHRALCVLRAQADRHAGVRRGHRRRRAGRCSRPRSRPDRCRVYGVLSGGSALCKEAFSRIHARLDLTQQQHSPAASAAGPFAGGGVMQTVIGCLIAVAFAWAVAFQIGGEG